MHEFIYLASASPRRREILEQMGVHFEMLLADKNEDVENLERPRRGESARHYVQRVATLKNGAAILRRAARQLTEAPILCADTTVALGHLLLGKPGDARAAAGMLKLLSGARHRVLTTVAVSRGRKLHLATSETTVWFRSLSAREIQAYVASGEPFGKAGGYAIQGLGGQFVHRIDGSHSGVVGLPFFETAALLRQFGVRMAWPDRRGARVHRS